MDIIAVRFVEAGNPFDEVFEALAHGKRESVDRDPKFDVYRIYESTSIDAGKSETIKLTLSSPLRAS